jgi:hypothetical protein
VIDQHDKLREVAWNELFRWLVLLRSVRIALLARVIVLGALGLFATTLGWRCIVWLFSTSADPVIGEWRVVVSQWLWNESPEFTIVTPARSAQELFASAATGLTEAPVTLWLYLTRPFVDLFRSELTAVGFLCLLLCGVWELLVWGLFGGAITRIAALKFTRDEAPDLIGALRHALGKWLSYSMPPLLALAGAAIFGIQLAILGWVMRLSFLAMVSGLLWPFVLLLGLLMAILLIGALFGWPLMFATVSVEGTDAFDALGSSYAYTYQRPLRLLWYVFLAAILAAVSMFIVKLFAASAISLGNWSISWGLDEPTYRAIVAPHRQSEELFDATGVPPLAPAPLADSRPTDMPPAAADTIAASPEEPSGMASVAAAAIAFWKSLLGALAAGYQAGFLWVAAVGVYLLMRKDIDGAEMDEVYVEDEQDFGLPPLADDAITGIPEVDAEAESPTGDARPKADQPPGDGS